MKIQCACGAKYSFDITPEMAGSTIRFVCPACNLDSSELVNQLIRQELGIATQEAAPEQAAQPVPSPAVQISSSPLRVQAPARAEEAATAEVQQPPTHFCKKHPYQIATERCAVCGKPICPKCMEIFGCVCSAYCKGKAEAENIDVPFYENKKQAVEAKYWQKTGRIGAVIGVVLVMIVGAWAWYSFFGSRPGVVFSVRFPERSYSGQCFLCDKNQLVVLHCCNLTRHDMKNKKEIWSAVLIEKKKIQEEAVASLKRMAEARDRAIDRGADAGGWRLPREDEMFESMERAAIASLQLYVKDQNVWVSFPEKLVRFDWQTGQKLKEVALTNSFHRLIPKGNELLFVEETDNGERITHFSLASGESRTEEISGSRLGSIATIARDLKKIGTITNTGSPGTKPLDPAVIAANFQNLPFAAKLALPATLSVAANQQRALAEMRDALPKPASQADGALDLSERFTLEHFNKSCSHRRQTNRGRLGELLWPEPGRWR